MLLPLILNNLLMGTPPTPSNGVAQQDWGVSVRVETAWRTVVTDADSTAGEERVQLWTRPARTVHVRWVGIDRAEAQRLVFAILRSGHEQTRVPIACDQAVTTASSSSVTINCPTADRRFSAGYYCLIHDVSGGRAINPQVRYVTAVGGSSLTVTPALTGSYAAGAIVYPLILAEVELEREVEFPSSQVCVIEAAFREVIGVEALPALTNGLTSLGAFPTATVESATYNLMDEDHDWAAQFVAGHIRPGEDYERGRGRQVYKRGARPLWRWGAQFLFDTRTLAWDFLELLDNLRGRTGALWWPWPANVWSAQGYATTYVEISASGNLDDMEDLVSHVAIKFTSGTWAVRRISTVVLTGGVWRITPTENWPAGSLSDVSKVCPCALVRMESDAAEEEWLTDQVMRIGLSVREIMSEAAVASVSAPVEC